MIGQNISLDILIRIAFERLKQNIMAEGDCYPGDLLKNVPSADHSYWIKNPSLHRRLSRLYTNNPPSIEKRAETSITTGIIKPISESFEKLSKIINTANRD
jgi:hypothetical protein